MPTPIDASAIEYETIFVNAGRRGLEIELDPNDLVRLTGADLRPIARPTRP
jgi:Cys-tRNA(Pro)/Cys-tRNA(Cys) deacylase